MLIGGTHHWEFDWQGNVTRHYVETCEDSHWQKMESNIQLVTPSDFIAFVDECYNDSTQSFREEGGVRHSCLVLGCNQIWAIPPTKIPDGWTHREPTFTGFVEWLKRRK
jgi:hypothetical protein